MENISQGENSVRLKVRDQFYSEEALENTVELFSENFAVKQEENDGYLEVVMEPEKDVEVDKEELGLEFFNNLLAQEKSRLSLTLG